MTNSDVHIKSFYYYYYYYNSFITRLPTQKCSQPSLGATTVCIHSDSAVFAVFALLESL